MFVSEVCLITDVLAAVCVQVAILGSCSEAVCDAAYEYGKNVGIAFQV